MNYCGIFRGTQKGSEGKSKISHHLFAQERVSGIGHVQSIGSVEKWLLSICPGNGQAGSRCSLRTADTKAAGALPADVWVSPNETVAGAAGHP